MKNPPPFFTNTDDNTHCFQAALASILANFEPDKSFTFDELDKISGKPLGKWTWPTKTIVWLMERGYEVQVFDIFDYKEFVRRGKDYLVEIYGQEVANEQAKHSNLETEIKYAAELISKLPKISDGATLPKIIELLDEGYLIESNVNSAALDSQQGYVGHNVVVYNYDEEGLYLHDPGLPPKANLFVTYEHFDSSWSYPDKKSRNIIAIKKS